MENKKYYIGLDVGTSSVGFAVTDTNYNLIRKGKKDFWGIRLFNEGKTAEERRLFRCSRRRTQRKKERINLLKDLFETEILKVDEGFFQRISQSMYHYDDKTEQQKNSLFNDTSFIDKDYYKIYKTAFHLRNALIHGEVNDIRLLYLGIAHIIKNRGHFLLEGQELSQIKDFDNVYYQLKDYIDESFPEYSLTINDIKAFEEILKDNQLGISLKEKKIAELLLEKPTQKQKRIIKLISGGSVDLGKLYDDEFNDEDKKKKIDFKSNYDEVYHELEQILGERIQLIDIAKSLYDWSVLTNILKGNRYLSEAKIDAYETHQKELIQLKRIVKKYIPSEYRNIFTEPNIQNNYASYIGMTKKNGKKLVLTSKKCSQEDFCKFVSLKLTGIKIMNEDEEIIKKLKLNTLLGKQITKDNGIIPYQVHKTELKAILDANKENFPFLNVRDGKFTAAEKIEQIFSFRIPYYVGPLNPHSDNAWIVRESGKILPWNFEEMVDKAESAEKFISKMTSRCSYLSKPSIFVIPKNSLLYSKYMVLNELNTIKINGETISVELKKKIYHELFEKEPKVTVASLKKMLIKNCLADKGVEITGLNGDFKCSLKSHIDFTKIFGNYDEDMAEKIIKWIVLFSGEKSVLKNKIQTNYNLSDDEMKKVLSLKYSGFGNLSKELLTEIYSADKETGEAINIITALYETNNNLMQLLSKEFGYKEVIDSLNTSKDISKITYDDVKELYCSPAVKKAIWQAVLIVKEIEQVMGNKPEKIFIEVPRSEEKIKTQKSSRKSNLLPIYKTMGKEYADLLKELESYSDSDLRRKKLYLYFTQLGRCVYTGNDIAISDLFNNNIYDIEHIYPRSKTKDDSIHDNLVLVHKSANADKSDVYPIPEKYRQRELWELLHNKKLISDEKYKRLVRVEGFKDNELEGFIQRQLVETGQASKALAEIFVNYYTESNTKVVYVKANHVSDFRKEFNMLKCREVNDYHHAKDAYLNIVVGNLFNTKFTEKFFLQISKEKYTLNPKELYKWEVRKGDYYAWRPNETIKTVKSVIESNNILFTRQAYKSSGTLFDLTIYKKGEGEFAVKNPTNNQKQSAKLMDLNKYGGYKSIKGSYFCLVEHDIKGKKVRSIEYVPLYLAKQISENSSVLDKYIKNNLKLTNPRIIFKELKIDSLLNIDGFPMHLSGRTGVHIVYKGAAQLILDKKQEEYIKCVSNFVGFLKKNPNAKIDNNSIISKNANLDIFNTFIHKLENTLYSIRLSSTSKTLKDNEKKFKDLELDKQCVVLFNLLNLFSCKASKTDISLLGGRKSVGTILTSKTISKFNKVELINQSVTGIFQNRINLLK